MNYSVAAIDQGVGSCTLCLVHNPTSYTEAVPTHRALIRFYDPKPLYSCGTLQDYCISSIHHGQPRRGVDRLRFVAGDFADSYHSPSRRDASFIFRKGDRHGMSDCLGPAWWNCSDRTRKQVQQLPTLVRCRYD